MPSWAATGMDCSAVASSSLAPSGSVRLPWIYPVIDENVAPVATSASISLLVQSQISTAKPSSSIRRIRSSSGKSVKIISAQTASWNAITPPLSPAARTATGAWVCTDSMHASATASARRASTPVTEGLRPSRIAAANSTNSPVYASRISSVSLRTVSVLEPDAGEQLRAAACSAADGHHALGAEDLTAYVVAVRRGEIRLGHSAGAVVESDHHDGGVEQAGVLEVRGDQRVGGGVNLDRIGTRIQPEQGVEVMDQGEQEDRPRRDGGWIGQARIAGQRTHQLDRADRTGGDSLVSCGEAAVETTIEADLKDDPGRLRRRQRTISVGQVE